MTHAKSLPGGAHQVEADKKPKHHGRHRRVKHVTLEKHKGGGTMTTVHENPTGEYPNPHADETQVFTGDQFDSHVVPHLRKRFGGGAASDNDGDEGKD